MKTQPLGTHDKEHDAYVEDLAVAGESLKCAQTREQRVSDTMQGNSRATAGTSRRRAGVKTQTD